MCYTKNDYYDSLMFESWTILSISPEELELVQFEKKSVDKVQLRKEFSVEV